MAVFSSVQWNLNHYFPPLCLYVFRTLDDSVYRIALSLAKRYSVPLWDVYMTHLEFLFTDSGYAHTHSHSFKYHPIISPEMFFISCHSSSFPFAVTSSM